MEAQTAKRLKVLKDDSKRAKHKAYVDVDVDSMSAKLFLVIGAAFAVVGATDLALLWTPLRFGNPPWEFATLSRTFSSLPFFGLGLVLVSVGLVQHPKTKGLWIRLVAILFAVAAATLAVLGFLYVTVAPEIIRQTPPEGLEAVGKAIFKNGAEVLLYPIAFGAISIILWRGVRRST